MTTKKVIMICLDTFPEIGALKDLMVEKNFKRFDMICGGASNQATIETMIFGCTANDPIIRTSKPSKPSGKMDRSIFKRCEEKGYPVEYHNCDPALVNKINIDKKDPKKRDKTLRKFNEWSDPGPREKFYIAEKEYIHQLQNNEITTKANNPLLFWGNLSHWSDIDREVKDKDSKKEAKLTRALLATIEWLKYWDFDAKDSIFLVYSSSGHRVREIPGFDDYITYLYIKDNFTDIENLSSSSFYSPKNISEGNTVLASTDVYRFLEGSLYLSYFDLDFLGPRNIYEKYFWMEAPSVFSVTRILKGKKHDELIAVVYVAPGNKEDGWYIFEGDFGSRSTYRYFLYRDNYFTRHQISTMITSGGPFDGRSSFKIENSPSHLSIARELSSILHQRYGDLLKYQRPKD